MSSSKLPPRRKVALQQDPAMDELHGEIQLGLRENVSQFSLLVLING